MKSTTNFILCAGVAAAMLSCPGCSDETSSARSASLRIPKQSAEIVKQYYRDIVWRLPEKKYEYVYLLDGPTFIAKHRDEMLKTLEVVETAETDQITACFVRYSIGGSMYRQVDWLRKVDGEWRIAQRRYYSTYDDDPFKDGKPDQAKSLIKRAEQWEKESAPIWW